MHAHDTNYTVIKNGIVVVSGTGPAIRVDGNRLVIRDGPQETPPLRLTRAEAVRKLRHIIVCGQAGGFVTFDALRWLRDTGVAFSQLDWNGAVVIASGPRGPDQPDLRRAQALVCSGAVPKIADAITCETLRVKLSGQAQVAGLMGFSDASATISGFADAIAETDGKRALAIEAEAAWIYWNLWERMPVRFARRNPQRLGPNGRWRPGRPDPWLTFGSRTSLISGKPSRATTPGNALVNYLYAILESEMTVALLARGLDPGIGMFHADIDGRSSLTLDAIEALRPYVEYWLFTYLQASVFANRDFRELPDGEVRLSHPLNSHLAHTAALWRKACEPVAGWLARSFECASDRGQIRATLAPPAARVLRAEPEGGGRMTMPALAPPLPNFIGATTGRRLSAPSVLRQRSGVRDEPVPLMCWECGRALTPGRRAFCRDDCAEDYRRAMGKRRPTVVSDTRTSHERHRETTLAGQRAVERLPASERQALRHWYEERLQPRLSRMTPTEIASGTAMGRSYAYYIVAGTRVPHPRHYPDLAALVGVELPTKLAANLAGPKGVVAARSTGKAVAAQYGFVDGVGGISVTLVNNQTCPDGQTNCYLATVTETSAPRYFVSVLGVSAPTLSAGAMVDGAAVHDYCLVGLGTSGTSPAVRSNGSPQSNLNGCAAYSGTNMTCNGSNLNADFGDAVGTNSGCGATQNNNVTPIVDQYALLAKNIPTNNCTSYPQEPTKKSDPPLPTSNQWSGAQTLPATTILCGDQQLTGDWTLTTASPGSVLVIENGVLDTNGHTLLAGQNNQGLTIIFSGTNGGTYNHGPTGSGTLDYPAPTSGTWSGIAMYQDPKLTTGVNLTAAGNTPTWDITGAVYLPHSSVTLSGIVNKASNGAACFSLVADNVTFNGTGAIIPRGGCVAAGLTMPSDTVNGAYVLVK